MSVNHATLSQLGLDKTSLLLPAVARAAEELCVGRGWPDGVHTLLSELGAATGASRVWIFQTIELNEDFIIQDYIFEWAAEKRFVQLGMPAFSMFRSNLDLPLYRLIVEERSRGLGQSILTRDLEPSWLKDSQIKQGILSMLTIPIMVEGQWWGTLGFDDCEREYRWTEDEINLLRTASCLVTSAIVRDRLSAGLKQWRILQEITESATWTMDLKKGRFWCSGGLVRGPNSQIKPFGDDQYHKLRGAIRMIHPEDRAAFKSAIRAFFRGKSETFRHDLRLLDGHGRYRWVELLAQLSRDELGRQEQLSGIAIDIRRRKEREQHLRDRALTDPLTGVANRWTFEERIRELMQSFKTGGPLFSMLLFDLDHFKAINDSFGHPVGDEALIAVTRRCEESMRERDLLARIGGEEFAVILPGVDLSTARIIGERIRQRIDQMPLLPEHPDLRVTVSMGCATCDPERPSARHLCNATDMALYAAKRQGRNCLVCFDDIDESDSMPGTA